jgi:hypothetical protein
MKFQLFKVGRFEVVVARRGFFAWVKGRVLVNKLYKSMWANRRNTPGFNHE